MAYPTGATSQSTLAAAGIDEVAVAMLNAVNIGTLLVNRDGGVLFASDVARAIWGTHAGLDSMFPRARIGAADGSWAELVARVVQSGEPVDLAASFTPIDSSTACVVHMHCAPVLDAACDCVVVSLRSNQGQDSPWEEEAVSRRLASLGKVAAQVAHELNNPLDGILRYVNLALRMAEQTANPKLSDYLSESRTGLVRMVTIISELLEFARSSDAETAPVDINEVVQQAILSQTEAAKASGVVVTSDFQNEAMPEIRGTRLLQVCGNLIKNAIEAMPDGGRVTITTGLVGGDVVIRVADTGPGLPEDHQKVFEPFFTTKGVGKGTGIGLAICKDFIEDLGGTIAAAPGNEGGAAFTIRLPKTCFEPASTEKRLGRH